MKNILALLAFLSFFFLALPAHSEETCPSGKTCVDNADMPIFIQALKEKKCLLTTTPQIKADPLTVVIDRQGRVYGSGSGPQPFKVDVAWCSYDIHAEGQTRITTAERIEPDWGFRFRPKATVGLLGTELLLGSKFTDALDGGLLVEPFYYHFLNINAYVGIRSFGAALGVDLVRNFGISAGYAVTWGGWRSNPMAGLYFSFL